ncbi:hypothetical protein V1281_000374 [Nitrobacteraceae bacterium AZCC 2161]
MEAPNLMNGVVMSNASNICGGGSAIPPPKARDMLKARNTLSVYLFDIGEAGASRPAGRSLKEIARCARISVRSAQCMRPLIGRWANTLGTSAASGLGGH